MNWVITLTILGLLISLYAVRIHIRSVFYPEKNHEICDLSEHVSCSKVLRSKYARLFLIPNSYWGVLFYLAVFVLAIYNFERYVFYASIIAVLGSILLGYLQYFKVKNMCLLCSSIYIVNFLLLIFSWP